MYCTLISTDKHLQSCWLCEFVLYCILRHVSLKELSFSSVWNCHCNSLCLSHLFWLRGGITGNRDEISVLTTRLKNKHGHWHLTALIVIRYLQRGDVRPEVAVMAVKLALDLQVVLAKPLTLNLSNWNQSHNWVVLATKIKWTHLVLSLFLFSLFDLFYFIVLVMEIRLQDCVWVWRGVGLWDTIKGTAIKRD